MKWINFSLLSWLHTIKNFSGVGGAPTFDSGAATFDSTAYTFDQT